MKVFLSWSGDLSRRIATALAEWLPPVINAVDPFISSEIEKGAQWAGALSTELQGSRAGIICLTPDNLNSPWLNYEAGALSKSVTLDDDTSAPARVWTYLFRLRAADVRYPLAQFQHTEATREDTARLVRGINSAVSRSGERALPEPQLAKAFDQWWPELEAVLTSLPQLNSATQPARTPLRPTEEMLAEILELLRSQQVAGVSGSVDSELAKVVGVTPPARVYVKGEARSISELVRSLRSLYGIAGAHVEMDTEGTFLRVYFSIYVSHSGFEEVVQHRAAENNVIVNAIQW